MSNDLISGDKGSLFGSYVEGNGNRLGVMAGRGSSKGIVVNREVELIGSLELFYAEKPPHQTTVFLFFKKCCNFVFLFLSFVL